MLLSRISPVITWQIFGKNSLFFKLRCSTLMSSSFTSKAGDKPISRYPFPEVKSLPADLQELMEQNQEKAGFIPNVFKVLSHRPNQLRSFVDNYNVVMDNREGGNLTKADKEMIIVAMSAFNRCRYCVVAHSALHRIYSKNPIQADQIAVNWETADLDDRQKAILDFAMDVTKCKPLSEDKFKVLYDHDLDDEDAWDIGSVVALFSLANRMAFLTSMSPNEEFYMLGRKPRET